MSTSSDDQRTAAHLGALTILTLAATAPLAVSIVWFANLGCPKLWHILAGPVALAVVVGLMARVLASLARDPLPGESGCTEDCDYSTGGGRDE